MAEDVIHVNEQQHSWEDDPDDEGLAVRIRIRTLVSGARTASSGISLGTFELPPGAVLAPHHHHPQEIYYVTAGEAEVFHSGDWHALRRGDVVYFPADAVHGARNRGASTCTIVWAFPVDSYDAIEYFGEPDAGR